MGRLSDADTARLLSRLRFRHLQLLVELGRGHSLRAAAAAFGVTQPALSRTLGEAEAAFGLKLFERSVRGMVPTTAGEAAIRGASLLMEEAIHLRSEAAQEDRATLIRLGATPFVAQGYLPDRLPLLAARDPPVRISLIEADIPTLVDKLLNGELDAALCSLSGAIRQPGMRRLRYEGLFPAGFAVIASRQHPLARAKRVPWEVLARERWVLPPATAVLYRMVEEEFFRHGLTMPRAFVEAGAPVTAARLAAAGAGLAVVPALTLTYLRAEGGCLRIAADPPLRTEEIGLVSRAGAVNERVAAIRAMLAGRPGL